MICARCTESVSEVDTAQIDGSRYCRKCAFMVNLEEKTDRERGERDLANMNRRSLTDRFFSTSVGGEFIFWVMAIAFVVLFGAFAMLINAAH